MNNDPDLYAESNSCQILTSRSIFREFFHKLKWGKDGGDSILDIGCGTGDVLIKAILPLLPTHFDRLIGCDYSSNMVDHARQHNGHPKIMYTVFDITGDVDDFIAEYGRFDHAISFFCLHWVQNQAAAMKNICKLLAPNGDCLLFFILSSNLFEVYDKMIESSKWSEYVREVKDYASPYYHSSNRMNDLRQFLQSAGFSDFSIEFRTIRHPYRNYEEFISKTQLCFIVEGAFLVIL